MTTTTGKAADTLEHGPPRDTESEMALLGSIAIDPDCLRTAAAAMLPHHFYDEQHADIFAVYRGMARDGLPIDDPIALAGELAKRSHWKNKQEAAATIAKLAKAAPSTAHAPLYAKQIIEAWRKRKLRDTFIRQIAATNNGQAADSIIAEAQYELEELLAGSDHEQEPEPVCIGRLIADHPRQREVIIDGLLRRGETANIIAAPKVGKSWLAYGLSLSIATGREWLRTYPCCKGRVLLVDNELHGESIASRLPYVAKAMGIRAEEYADALDVLSLRGRLLDLHGITRLLGRMAPGQYDLVILDAWYRSLPAGASENDNGEIMRLYNLIDATTSRLNAAWLNVHHASKGSQVEKAVTDVGAGAGSQSRAADCHIVLRPHEEGGCVVLEAAVRSFSPVDPLPLRWDFPIWFPDGELDPAALKGRKSRAQERQNEADEKGIEAILSALAEGPATTSVVRQRTGISVDRAKRLLGVLYAAKKVISVTTKIRGNECAQYQLPE